MLSSSDHSDIMTLGDSKEGEHTEEDAVANEERYLGTSCSSHYTFTAAETGRTAESHAVTHGTSSVFSSTHTLCYTHTQTFDVGGFQHKTVIVCLNRFVVESLETSTNAGELKLPSEESIHWRPIRSRWLD